MWRKPIRLEFSEHELRTLRGAIDARLAEQNKFLTKFTPTTTMYAGTKLRCDNLTNLKTKLNRALGGVH